MNQKDFVNLMVGKPWVNRGFNIDGCDCFGLVFLYMYHVENKLPTLTPEYLNNSDFEKAFYSILETGEWVKQDEPTEDSIIFMMFNGEIPMHCGIMLDAVNCLHSYGEMNNGQVVVWKLKQVKKHLSRFFNVGQSPRVEFYKWVN